MNHCSSEHPWFIASADEQSMAQIREILFGEQTRQRIARRELSEVLNARAQEIATMILEVYYRHMPLYADAAAEDDFPL